ncbi:MAG: hydroxymethylbilane synthase [Chitinophagaceae bacterium]|nr:hydroxymethylbilane synthase [Chitinophagaceae bacterium]MCW5929738.1 hydroxymethylbilane synthase [Chitinophagaceae bacterium]
MSLIRIGTRDSELATWQAKRVAGLLNEKGLKTELVFIKSEGDINLTVPLYEMGVQGIFTKALDIALLEKRIDLAVHSYKDVPTQLARGLAKAAVLKRDSYKDILVCKSGKNEYAEALGYQDGQWTVPSGGGFIVATSSTRRRAQWLNRYPGHRIENLRGNINRRLQKLQESNWQGAIFAAAGLDRIRIRPENSIELDWMLPAPAQGTIVMAAREDDHDLLSACSILNHADTDTCTGVERDFLKALGGGCATPVGALAEITGDLLHFRGNLVSADGKIKVETEWKVPVADAGKTGALAAKEILNNGGVPIIESIRNGGA